MNQTIWKRYVYNTINIIVGYLIAVFVSFTVIYIPLLLFNSNYLSLSLDKMFPSGFFEFYWVAVVYVGIFAFPGWLPLAIIAKWQGANRKLWYILGGAFVGLAAVILETLTMMGGFFYDFPLEMRLIVPVAGLFGGLAYWVVTARPRNTGTEKV